MGPRRRGRGVCGSGPEEVGQLAARSARAAAPLQRPSPGRHARWWSEPRPAARPRARRSPWARRARTPSCPRSTRRRSTRARPRGRGPPARA
eukprot:2658096-Pyramimonas_sp.AAC.1